MILPLWNSLVQIENRFTLLKANFVKEPNVTVEVLSDPITVIEPHRDGQRHPVKQFLRHLALDMIGRVTPFHGEALANQGMNVLGVGLDARRADDVGRGAAKQRLQGVFGDYAPKDIPAADE